MKLRKGKGGLEEFGALQVPEQRRDQATVAEEHDAGGEDPDDEERDTRHPAVVPQGEKRVLHREEREEDGEDEEEALKTLIEAIESGLGE